VRNKQKIFLFLFFLLANEHVLCLTDIVNLCDIRDGISKFLGIYLIIQRYIQEIYTIEIISNVTFHVRGPFVVR